MPQRTLNPKISPEWITKLRNAGSSLSLLNKGIEKEALRISPDGRLSQTSHPTALGSPLTNPYITTDFSESQLELITGVHSSTTRCLEELHNIQGFVYQNIGEQILWPHSMPCQINENESIPLAQYGSTNIAQSKTIYRRGLHNRYGSLMQTISGIHYNFSIPEECWIKLGFHEQQARTQAYFDLIRNFRRWSWLLLYLFGASPMIPKRLAALSNDNQMLSLDAQTLYKPYATSLRMGPLGYQSDAQNKFSISYNSLEEYVKGMKAALTQNHQKYEAIGLKKGATYQQLNTSLLQIENEFYGSIRPKRAPIEGERQVTALENRGVEYIEVRCLDLDPYLPMGVEDDQIRFIDTFLIVCLLSESQPDSEKENTLINQNQSAVIGDGRQRHLLLKNPEDVNLKSWAKLITNECRVVAKVLDEANNSSSHSHSVELQENKIDNPDKTPSERLLNQLKTSGQSFQKLGIELGHKHKKNHQAEILSTRTVSHFQQQSRNSIIRLNELEHSKEEPFETFLKTYTSVE